MNRFIKSSIVGALFALVASAAYAQGAAPAAPAAPATDWTAVAIFAAFVALTLGITYWAAQHTRTTKDFYAAGGGVSGFQNG
jgi:cation/acetate symporter